MARIALVGFDGPLGAKLGLELFESFRLRKHIVTFLEPGASIIRMLKGLDHLPDFLYLYSRLPDERTESYLDQLQCFWTENWPLPLVQCVLQEFFGARYQLSLEQKGARVAYQPEDGRRQS